VLIVVGAVEVGPNTHDLRVWWVSAQTGEILHETPFAASADDDKFNESSRLAGSGGGPPTSRPCSRPQRRRSSSAVVWLLEALGRFEQRAKGKGPVRYNDFFAVMNSTKEKDEPEGDDAARGKVALSTLHSAKGLEWPWCS